MKKLIAGIAALAFATVGYAQTTTVAMTNTIAATVTLTNTISAQSLLSGSTTGLVRCASWNNVAIQCRSCQTNGENSAMTVTFLGSVDGTFFENTPTIATWTFTGTGSTTNYAQTNITVNGLRALLIWKVATSATNVGPTTQLQFKYNGK